MDKPSVFAFSNYLNFFNSWIKASDEQWGLLTKVAKAIGCQRPYLSKVLAGGAHLTSAQGYGLAKFCGLNNDETEYFLGLLEIERASTAEYREYWKRKNQELKRRHENLSSKVKRDLTELHEKSMLYYSSWYWTAIHMLTSIPEFQTEAAMSERLQLSTMQVRQVLQTLLEWGYVEKSGNRWKYLSSEQHVPKNSPLVLFHHQNWRNRAMNDAQMPGEDSVHFTVVQSLSRGDYEKVKQIVIDAIQSIIDTAGPSKEEEMMSFTCDLFKP